jgi:predicted RNase H-like HicB family nuclease
MRLNIVVERDESGYFVAEVPALPGCLSQGRTRREALRNIHEAIEGWLEVMQARRRTGRPSRRAELVEVRV